MAQRVTITVKRGSDLQDVNVPLTTTPLNIAAGLKWGQIETAIIQRSNLTIDGNDSLEGKVREGDLIIFDAEVSAGWRS